MFETKMYKRDQLTNYIGARVTDEEAAWLKSETQRRKLSMSDLLRLALAKLHAPKKKGSKAP
jgi:hypothetical protein